MAGKKAAGENSKKAAGNAKKAEAASAKAAVENQKKAAVEDEDWERGAKNNSKKEADAAKKAEQARKKAEKDAQLADEERAVRTTPKAPKQAIKKPARGLDLAQLDSGGSGNAPALNASGIDNALDALSLTAATDDGKIDKHPERRFKAAYAAFEERRLAEMEQSGEAKGLRMNQRKERVRKEFERSDENPFNAVSVRYDATKEEIREVKEGERRGIEERLAG